jgi:hypothetical protein
MSSIYEVEAAGSYRTSANFYHRSQRHVIAVTTVKTELILSVRVLRSCCAVLYYEHDDHLFLQPQQSLLDFFFGHSTKFTRIVAAGFELLIMYKKRIRGLAVHYTWPAE